MKTITNFGQESNNIIKVSQPFLKQFGIGRIFRKHNVDKKCGFAALCIFAFLIGLVFSGKRLYTLASTRKDGLGFGKDVIYRFLNQQSVNWEAMFSAISNAVVPEIDRLTSDERRAALILDDTSYYRDRSKKVELLSRCYDHAENKYYNGFNVLTMGWSDGQTFLPVDYRVVASGNDENLREPSHLPRDGRTIATKRRDSARTSKTELSLEMLKAAKGTASECKHVLFDSWFTSPKMLLGIKSLGYDAVGRLKNKANHRYWVDGRPVTVSEIYKANRKRPGKSRYLLSVQVEVRQDTFSEPIPARIVYVRNKKNRKEWVAFICTDMSLNEDEIIALYGKRWDIEPFFKVCKSLLRLENEFQSRSFDAIAAHTAVVFTRYLILALKNREGKDDRTVCAIFYAFFDELKDISFESALNLIMSLLTDSLRDYMHLENSQLDAFVAHFISQMPADFKLLLAS